MRLIRISNSTFLLLKTRHTPVDYISSNIITSVPQMWLIFCCICPVWEMSWRKLYDLFDTVTIII